MPVIEWRGQKLRLDEDGTQLTLKQARVIKRFTGLRVVAFQKAMEQMVADEDLDPELVQAFLWLLLDQNGQHIDITDLDDVSLDEFGTSMAAAVTDGTPVVVDPTPAAGSDQPPISSSNESLTETSTVG